MGDNMHTSSDDDHGADEYPALHALENISGNDMPFVLPKDVEVGDQLMWTKQTDRLARAIDARKGFPGVAKNSFILAGPSGVGKSCIALSIALRLRRRNEVVLYVSDAGILVDIAARDSESPSQTSKNILALLSQMFKDQNPSQEDIKSDTFENFAKELNKLNAVVIIDEQGSAYMKLRSAGYLFVFPFITPNYWVHGRSVRVVLIGSNQAAFETALNGTYAECLRYIVPMNPKDAAALNVTKAWNLPDDYIPYYCNYVPREMKKLAEDYKKDGEAYLKFRAEQIYRSLSDRFRSDPVYPNKGISNMLRYLFRNRSLHPGYDLVPFIDLGFVYRIRGPDQMLAFPLCRAAETALLQLWKDVDTQPPFTLSDCVRLSRGDDFELLVFHALVKKHVVEDAQLPLIHLGFFGFEERLPLRIDTVYTAPCGSSDYDVIADITRIRRVASARDLTVLYQCPKDPETIDFCVLSKTHLLAIQETLQSLTNHDPPNGKFLTNIWATNPTQATRSSENFIWRYIHITTQPEKHPIIAQYRTWNEIDVSKIRLVDANTWLGRTTYAD